MWCVIRLVHPLASVFLEMQRESIYSLFYFRLLPILLPYKTLQISYFLHKNAI